MSKDITKCPICGTKLLSTRMSYATDIVLDSDGSLKYRGKHESKGDTIIYCENDHSYKQIMEAMNIRI